MICPWKLFFSGNISNQKNLQQFKKNSKNTKSLSRGSILFNLTISTRFDGAYMMKAQSAKHNLASTNELLRFNTHHQIRLNNAITIGSVSSFKMLLSLNCVGQPPKKWILDLLMVYVKALMYYCEPNVNVISTQQTGVLTINLCKTTLDLHLIIQRCQKYCRQWQKPRMIPSPVLRYYWTGWIST